MTEGTRLPTSPHSVALSTGTTLSTRGGEGEPGHVSTLYTRELCPPTCSFQAAHTALPCWRGAQLSCPMMVPSNRVMLLGTGYFKE